MNVYQKLNAAREEFHSLKLEKTGENKFAGYKYFELGDFLIPALKVFAKHGLCGTISFNKDFAKMCVVNTEKIDEYIPFESPMGSAALKGCHEVQNIGAVETYQRRYLWVAALEIVEHDALDATTGQDDAKQRDLSKGGTFKQGARDGIGDDLPTEDKDFLKELAAWCKENIGTAAMVAQHIAQQRLDSDQRVYLENQLDSKTRAAIKKAEQDIRAAFRTPEPA